MSNVRYVVESMKQHATNARVKFEWVGKTVTCQTNDLANQWLISKPMTCQTNDLANQWLSKPMT